MSRASMIEIINHLRDMTNDGGSVQAFDDDTIQTFCDRYQSWWRIVELQAVYSVAPGGITKFYDFYASVGWWENDVQLQDNTWAVAIPTTADRISGHWTFDVQPAFPIYITGKLYDVYAIAADICEARASKYVERHDNQSGQFKNSRSQWYSHMQRQAKMFRAQARTSSATIVRSDLASDTGMW